MDPKKKKKLHHKISQLQLHQEDIDNNQKRSIPRLEYKENYFLQEIHS